MNKESIEINTYKFDKIASTMQKKFGNLTEGEEDRYNYELCTIEIHILQQHMDKQLVDRHVSEALKLVLFKVEGYLNNEEYEFENLLDRESVELSEVIAKVFIPFEEKTLKAELSKKYDLDNKECLCELFELPVKCTLKILKSAERWRKWNGSNGYLNFIKEMLNPILEQMDTFEYFYKDIKKL